jgi:hypothetical protein
VVFPAPFGLKMSRKIIRLRDGKEYESLTLAAQDNACDISDLSRAARFHNDVKNNFAYNLRD